MCSAISKLADQCSQLAEWPDWQIGRTTDKIVCSCALNENLLPGLDVIVACLDVCVLEDVQPFLGIHLHSLFRCTWPCLALNVNQYKYGWIAVTSSEGQEKGAPKFFCTAKTSFLPFRKSQSTRFYNSLPLYRADTRECDTSECDTSECDTSECDTSECDTSECDDVLEIYLC